VKQGVKIKPEDLGKALAEQLTIYHADKLEKVNAAGEKAVKQLVKQTKKSAPKASGDFAKSLTYATETKTGGDKAYTWGAKAPHHRLTHLLVHGHADVNGGRVPGNHFLEKALGTVLPEYERDVEEALKG
jgi:hypothetical protein